MSHPRVTVIIPTLNEETTITGIVHLVKSSPEVLEVIVVDDKSTDETVSRARSAGANVIMSTKLGKGTSMRDGLLVAKGDVLVYLDGDIPAYPADIIERLVRPILSGEMDFVKSCFARQAGRVTELVAKPLLSLLFPEINHFNQPLSGIIAGKKEVFSDLKFENDYGVDIGILIDVFLRGARIGEVNIGMIENKMKTWTALSPMSRQVSSAILRRASNSSTANLETLGIFNIIRSQLTDAIKESLMHMKKMVIFDMDGTILLGRFVEAAAREFGFQNQLVDTVAREEEAYVRTKAIAKLFAGMDFGKIIALVDSMNIIPDAEYAIRRLKSRGYVVGIVTDSYDCVAQRVQLRVGADFTLANELEFSDSVATGEVKIPSFFLRTPESSCGHALCKSNALMYVAREYGINMQNIIAIGDGMNDLCLLKRAGVGVAFCTEHSLLKQVANRTIEKPTFRPILDFAR